MAIRFTFQGYRHEMRNESRFRETSVKQEAFFLRLRL